MSVWTCLGDSTDRLIILPLRSEQPTARGSGTGGSLRETAARKYSEATVAVLITLAIVMGLIGSTIGAFLSLSFAIRREDRTRGSLRFAPPSSSTRAARALVGMSSSRWD